MTLGFSRMKDTQGPTVDGSEILRSPPGMVLKPVVNNGITGDRRISEPLTVGRSVYKPCQQYLSNWTFCWNERMKRKRENYPSFCSALPCITTPLLRTQSFLRDPIFRAETRFF